MSEDIEAPVCPGCHFGCLVSAYKCGRGKAFHNLWADGKPVPERGVPPMMRKEGAAGDSGGVPIPPVGARVMRGLNIMANILQDRHAEAAEHKVLIAVGRQGGFFAYDMLGKRTLLDDEAVAGAAEFLLEAGFATREEDAVAGSILRIAPAGKEQLAEWDAERDAATAEFLAPLSEDEQAHLSSLLFRIIQAELENHPPHG